MILLIDSSAFSRALLKISSTKDVEILSVFSIGIFNHWPLISSIDPLRDQFVRLFNTFVMIGSVQGFLGMGTFDVLQMFARYVGHLRSRSLSLEFIDEYRVFSLVNLTSLTVGTLVLEEMIGGEGHVERVSSSHSSRALSRENKLE